LEDWLFQPLPANERYSEFFADQNYLGDHVFSGHLQFYTNFAHQEGWLVYAGGSKRGLSPVVPEPATVMLVDLALLGVLKKQYNAASPSLT